MTPQQAERYGARAAKDVADAYAEMLANNPRDAQAMAVAMLVVALIQSTPELSPRLRAALFLEQE